MSSLLDETKRYLQIANQQRSLHTMTPQEVRTVRAKMPKPSLQLSVSLAKIEDVDIPVRDGSIIKGRIYVPEGEGPFPVIIYYHGGGWVLNSIETSDASCQLLASKTKSIVVSVDYRLAPEYKFPTPVFDAYDAFLWIVQHIKNWSGDEHQLIIAGDSAGANLATVVTMLNEQEKKATIAAQLLLYPVTDLSCQTLSYEQFNIGYGLGKKDMEWFRSYYLNDEGEITNPLASPLQANDLSNLPQALIIVAEYDVLRDEGLAYGHKLASFHVNVEQIVAKGLVHSYFTRNEIFSESIEKTIDYIDAFIKNNVTLLNTVS